MKAPTLLLRQACGAYGIAKLDLENPLPAEIIVKMAVAGLGRADRHVTTVRMPLVISSSPDG